MGKLPVVLTAVALATGCLPGDTRPEPASISVTTGPSDAVRSGFVTSDGWEIQFERAVSAVGDLRLHKDECNKYAQTRYRRLFDFTVATEEKAGLIYGLGSCRLEFSFDHPRDDGPLGAGTTESDLVFMRTRATDGYAFDAEVTLWVIGTARRGDVVKSFDWPFRHGFELTDCAAVDGGPFLSELELATGDARQIRIEMSGEELFRQTPEEGSDLQFDAFAEADADGDDRVTIAELAGVPSPAIGVMSTESGAEPTGAEPGATLGDLVYLALLPRVGRLAGGGACVAEKEDNRW